MTQSNNKVAILGVFVADLSFRAQRQPGIGETVLGSGFALGPGGKGSNQAVAAAQLGADTTFITKLGRDEFAQMGFKIWQQAGVQTCITQTDQDYTGAAYIFVDEANGDNAIIISPGAGAGITPAIVEAASDVITQASVFMTQLEQPVNAAHHGLHIARRQGVTTILNPAPAAQLDDATLALCDYVTPNETEAQQLTGIDVTNLQQARNAADALLAKGISNVVITLGEAGALLHNAGQTTHIEAFDAGRVIETTGAGDAFNGALATGLAQGMSAVDAVRFGCATAAISVTREGTAQSMPQLAEVKQLLAR